MATDYTEWLERVTDAGTRELIPDPGSVDDRPYNEEAWEDYMELRNMAVAALSVAVLGACGGSAEPTAEEIAAAQPCPVNPANCPPPKPATGG